MRMIVSTVAVVALLGAVPALAAVSGADKTFATEAAHGGLAEVQMGQLALQKASSPQVKEFAQRMVTDHSQANQDLMQLGKSENLTLPTQLDAKHKSEMDRLRAMSGNAFDATYMQHMVQDHKKTVADFQKEAQSGSDPALKSFSAEVSADHQAASSDGGDECRQGLRLRPLLATQCVSRIELRAEDRVGLLRNAEGGTGRRASACEYYRAGTKAVEFLLLGLYGEDGLFHYVGRCGIGKTNGREIADLLEPLMGGSGFTGRAPGGVSRWSGREREPVLLQPKLVVEVEADHIENGRFRHGSRLLRWRHDKPPSACLMDQVLPRR